MFLIVGLGNPGEKYHFTKHNFGFLLSDQVIQDYNLILKSKKSGYELFSGEVNDSSILLLKPLKYMNLSGSPILEVKNFYKIELPNIIVLHDDLDLEFGKIKLKIGGGHAGHNGLKDIDQKIGADYLRLRLGIGRPIHKDYEISDYVLSNFSKEELLEVTAINKKISDILPILLSKGKDEFLNQFHLNK